MKRFSWLSAAILCATSACAPATHRLVKASQTITVTGCVQNNGAKSSATMDGGYMLTNTVTGNASAAFPSSPGSIGPPPHDDSPGSTSTGSGGTPAASAAPAARDEAEMERHQSASYMLEGRDAELRNYIDKRAEITGTLEMRMDGVGDLDSKPTRGSVIPHGRNSGLQWLRVASVKVISSDCSAKRTKT